MLNLSVILPTRCDRRQLLSTLRALCAQSLPTSAWELILVTNGSTLCSKTEAIATETLNASALNWTREHVPESGVNRARNRGADRARAQTLLFLDDDCQPPDVQFLERVLKLHRRHSSTLAIGGYYLNSPQPKWSDKWYNRMCNTWLNYYMTEGKSAQLLLGGCFSISTSLFQSVRMDERYTSGADETSFFLALTSGGGRLLLDQGHSVIHEPRKTLRSLLTTAIRQGRGRRSTPEIQRLKRNRQVFKDALMPHSWPFWCTLSIYYALIRLAS